MTVSVRRAPDVSSPTPADVAALARRLRATHARLRSRPAYEVAAALGAAGRRFLDPGDALRKEALERLPESSGMSSASCERTLDGMAADWTEERLRRLLDVELGDPCPLDAFVERDGRRSLAIGPALCVQVAAGGVPGVGVTAVVRSLLVKAPTLLKAGRDDLLLPLLFARALADVDAQLAESLAVVHWPGEGVAHRAALLDAALAEAEAIVAYGSDEAVAAVRSRAPLTARFVAYHHRVSVGVVGRDALERASLDAVAAEVAQAIAAYDQRGCVSPQVVWVEAGGACAPRELAVALARALEGAEARWPSAPLGAGEASALHQARGTAELIAAARGGEVHHGGPAAWTVVLETGEGDPGPAAGRFVRVRSVADAAELTGVLADLGPHLQTVGFAGLDGRIEALARALGEAGASRVAPFSAVAFPPAWWHHDGRGPLLDLARWVDLEEPETGSTLPASAAPPSR